MSDIKFACPTCQQHIQCEPAYAGMQIACPACQSQMIVPGSPAPAMASAPAMAPSPGLRMSSAAPPPPLPPQPQAPAETGRTCPSCGNPVAPAALMCIKCGTNLRTGQKMAAPGRPGAIRPVGEPVPWYKNANVYCGIVLGIYVVLYGFAWLSPMGNLAYLGFWLLFTLGAAIYTLVAAFQEGVGTGFLTLCVPFYVFYFVYAKCDNKLVKAMYSLAILGRLGIWFMPSHSGD